MFESVVRLYRAAGKPSVEEGAFSYDGQASAVATEVQKCLAIDRKFGYFEDGPHEDDGQMSFTWKLPSNEFGRFYADVYGFVDGSEILSSGGVPSNYYLIREDILGGAEEPTSELTSALHLGRLIGGLIKLSLNTVSLSASTKKLLFVLPATGDAGPKTFEIDTRITRACLLAPKPDISVLEALFSSEEGRLHINEHKQLFRVALTNVLAKRRPDAPEPVFQYLVYSWSDVVMAYELNAECYVQKFSFEKLRGDVARIELDYASRMAAVLGDSSGKMLALPLSIGGLAAVWLAEDVWSASGLCLGMLLVSLLLSGILHNQRLASNRVEAGFNLSISDVQSASGKHPTALQGAIDSAKAGFAEQLAFLRKVHMVVHPLAWLPTLIAVAMVILRFGAKALPSIGLIILLVVGAIAFFQSRALTKG
ncbi:hypothetical protein E4A48_11575 [Xanthomonas cerealis pv. cerealis]|uniref:Uncharacterized protein n=1 Tax=Xanthomonas cerealis pv. cerealis TaxID=152263 RepID=A0A514EDX9_9XANT|nr:hypothetical protein [Xanthomonas translucens]QDI04248.1 hypothetical protein E4A48_11575 [Xanthomonas translucens pv. cerealis]